MNRLFNASTIALALALLGAPAVAQSEKEFTTKSGTSVLIINLISPRPDCSINPGPIAVPVVREKPANGMIQMQVVATDIAASQNCPARKIPSIALVYTPSKNFVGTDTVLIEVEAGNSTTTLRYRVKVQATAERI